jgi:hypothetical protein
MKLMQELSSNHNETIERFLSILNFESIEILHSVLQLLKSTEETTVDEVLPKNYRKTKFILILKALGFFFNVEQTKVLPFSQENIMKKKQDKRRKVEKHIVTPKNKLMNVVEFRIKIHEISLKVFEKEIKFVEENFPKVSLDHFKIVEIDKIKNALYIGNIVRSNGDQYFVVLGYYSDAPVLIKFDRCDFEVKECLQMEQKYNLDQFEKLIPKESLNILYKDEFFYYLEHFPKCSNLSKLEMEKLDEYYDILDLGIEIISCIFSLLLDRNPVLIHEYLIKKEIDKLDSIEKIDEKIREIELLLIESSNKEGFEAFSKEKKTKINDNLFYQIDDISQGKTAQPIPLINEINFEPYINIYINENICGNDVDSKLLFDPNFIFGCFCSQEDCWDSGCDCLKENLIVPYIDNKLNLDLNFANIYECNSKCECSFNCPLRVVQKGIEIKVEIYCHPNIGWGAKSLQSNHF